METPNDGEKAAGAELHEGGDVAVPGLMSWGMLAHLPATRAGRYDLGGQDFGEGTGSVADYFASGAADGLPQTHPDQSVQLYSPEGQ